MKRVFIYLMFLFLIPGVMLAQESRVDLGISVSDGKLRSFYLAVSDYYGVSGKTVVATKERYHLRDEELPVIYFLSARARVAPSVIVGLRIKGLSWLDITFHYGLTPEIFYVPVTVQKIGPPYGKAYGHFKKYRSKKEWKKIVLSDHEVADLVNLRFISEHYKVKPELVMEMRSQGKNFLTINEENRKAKAKAKGKSGKPKKVKPRKKK
ncbi:MAG: hypothetical protein GTO16_03280 [Candidatus Aminicenantes bacterium]|nr:hypothetical protein [Candidatus Aminicenantes bacterium]